MSSGRWNARYDVTRLGQGNVLNAKPAEFRHEETRKLELILTRRLGLTVAVRCRPDLHVTQEALTDIVLKPGTLVLHPERLVLSSIFIQHEADNTRPAAVCQTIDGQHRCAYGSQLLELMFVGILRT